MTEAPAVYLASRSPRRRELLDQMGVAWRQVDVAVEESRRPEESPADFVLRLAMDKALAARRLLRAGVTVLAADTAVVLDGEVLGKPRDEAHAAATLARLSGRQHQVFTGVALAGDACRTRLSESRVRFRSLSAAERTAYVATGEPMDKAGAYAIQGRAAVFIEHLDGSYSGVMGLPIYETAQLLREAGIEVLR